MSRRELQDFCAGLGEQVRELADCDWPKRLRYALVLVEPESGEWALHSSANELAALARALEEARLDLRDRMAAP